MHEYRVVRVTYGVAVTSRLTISSDTGDLKMPPVSFLATISSTLAMACMQHGGGKAST